jgi:hypothetical protein
MKLKTALLALAMLCPLTFAIGQNFAFNGQVYGWSLYTESTSEARFGIRYLPQLLYDQKLSTGQMLDAELILNAYATAGYPKDKPSETEARLKPYRAKLRFVSGDYEAIAGLQQISFGAASLFRPLMWFDQMDPRDPIHYTDGVYALLLRYHMQPEASIWLWGITGGDKVKGWETAQTTKKSIEFGARIQSAVGPGLAGLSFHQRQADTLAVYALQPNAPETAIPETRFGVDGKWDLGYGIGLWFEATLTHGQMFSPDRMYERQYVAGAGYTFSTTGNALNCLLEYFRTEHAAETFGPSSTGHVVGFQFKYPIDSTSQVSGIIYSDLVTRDTYRFLTWQSVFKGWSFYAMAFVNPSNIRLIGPQGYNGTFAGSGGQIMLVVNH